MCVFAKLCWPVVERTQCKNSNCQSPVLQDKRDVVGKSMGHSTSNSWHRRHLLTMIRIPTCTMSKAEATGFARTLSVLRTPHNGSSPNVFSIPNKKEVWRHPRPWSLAETAAMAKLMAVSRTPRRKRIPNDFIIPDKKRGVTTSTSRNLKFFDAKAAQAPHPSDHPKRCGHPPLGPPQEVRTPPLRDTKRGADTPPRDPSVRPPSREQGADTRGVRTSGGVSAPLSLGRGGLMETCPALSGRWRPHLQGGPAQS